MKHGDPAAAIRLLRTAVASSERASFELHKTIFVGTMAYALAATGRIDDALSAVNKALEESKACESYWCVPELLRLSATPTPKQALTRAQAAAEMDLSAVPHRDRRRRWNLKDRAQPEEASAEKITAGRSRRDGHSIVTVKGSGDGAQTSSHSQKADQALCES